MKPHGFRISVKTREPNLLFLTSTQEKLEKDEGSE